VCRVKGDDSSAARQTKKKKLPDEYGPIKKGSQMPGRRSQSKRTRQQNSRPVSESSPPLSHSGGRKRVNKKIAVSFKQANHSET
jgi:hypothetical protein